MKTTQTLFAAAVLFTFVGTANATLVPALGGKVVNDTDLNITWLADANLAATNSFGLARNVNLDNVAGADIYDDGRMTWSGAMKWIAAMNASNDGAGYLGYNNWRLPTTTDMGASGYNFSYNGTDGGYNSTGSEMSHLYYIELGNKSRYNTSGVAQLGYGLVNKGPFTNFQSMHYWSGTEYAPTPTVAWIFGTEYGLQYYQGKSHTAFALAVRSGQVAAVPVPAAAWLLGSGLLSLIGVARRKAA